MRFWVAGFTIFLIAGVFFIIHSNIFVIKSIDVHADKVNCFKSDELKKSSNLLGQNIFLINSSKIESAIKNKFVCVKDVEIKREIPDKVKILISGRIPKALVLKLKISEASESSLENIATPSAQQEILEISNVDSDGVIFDNNLPNLETTLPKIYIHQTKVNITSAIKILEKVQNFIKTSQSEILDDSLIVYPETFGSRIIFKLDNNLDMQLASLQLILMQAKIDGKDLEFIDLRFDKPIVKFAPKKS